MATKPGPDHLQNQRPCNKCGRPIGFLRSPTGAAIVLDAKPVQVTLPTGESAWAYMSHWGTCPKAREVRAEIDAKRAAPATGEAERPSQPQASAPTTCPRCERPLLNPGIPLCAPCWNGLGPAEQAKVLRAAEKIERRLSEPEPLFRRPGMQCSTIAIPGGTAIVCTRGRRPRR